MTTLKRVGLVLVLALVVGGGNAVSAEGEDCAEINPRWLDCEPTDIPVDEDDPTEDPVDPPEPEPIVCVDVGRGDWYPLGWDGLVDTDNPCEPL